MNPNISHENKIVFIHNPKTAGTSLRRWLGFEDEWNHGFPTMNTPREIWNAYTCVVTVRDPIERAVSGYRYMTNPEYVGSFRAQYPDLPSWDPLTFFRRMFNEQVFVLPQQFKYTTHLSSNKAPDFILKFENLDVTELAKKLGITRPFPHDNVGPPAVPVDLSEDLYVALIDHYKVDYLLFGYRPKPYKEFMAWQERAAA